MGVKGCGLLNSGESSPGNPLNQGNFEKKGNFEWLSFLLFKQDEGGSRVTLETKTLRR
jgi:hypothetical protein